MQLVPIPPRQAMKPRAMLDELDLLTKCDPYVGSEVTRLWCDDIAAMARGLAVKYQPKDEESYELYRDRLERVLSAQEERKHVKEQRKEARARAELDRGEGPGH